MYLCDIIHNKVAALHSHFALWIAYKMYLCDIIHNAIRPWRCRYIVVNCLQNVSLRYYSQSSIYYSWNKTCCELLTKCIFAILFTINFIFILVKFRCELLTKCIFAILFTIPIPVLFPIFRCELLTKCIFAILFTMQPKKAKIKNSCELLTKCIFAILFTMYWYLHHWQLLLWIAYKMYLCDIIHNAQNLTTHKK